MLSSRAGGSAPLVKSEDQVLPTCLLSHRSSCHSHHHADLERTEPRAGAFRLPDLSPHRSELHSEELPGDELVRDRGGGDPTRPC